MLMYIIYSSDLGFWGVIINALREQNCGYKKWDCRIVNFLRRKC